MKLKSIHHIAIICSNYKKSKEFYTVILGLEVIREVYRKEKESFKLDLKVGDKYQIELFSFPSTPKRLSFPEAVGLRHLAFKVENINEAYENLKSKDVRIEEIKKDPTTGKKCFFFFDPDGLPLEIYES